MRKKFSLLALVSLLLLAIVPAGTALAAKPVPFGAGGIVAVTSIATPIPAGISGRVRITSETLASISPVMSPDSPLDGKVLSLQQKSNELFSSPDLTTAVAVDGSATGTFVVVDPFTNAPIAAGQYHLNVSNIPGCQIYDNGHWSTTGGSLKGRGTVTACLNFVPAYGTFVGSVAFTGTLN